MLDIYNHLKNQYQNKKVLIVGLGLQGGGVGLAKFFSEIGAKVIVNDKKTEDQLRLSIDKLVNYNVEFHLGGHYLEDFLSADVIFKGPSVLWTIPEILEAEKKGIPIEMELSFFAKNFPGRVIGITGTRGKSTTTNMIFYLLKKSDFSVFLTGGLPGISTINYLKTLKKDDWVVMELSSWALSGFHKKKISPHIAVFTSFYPDHLNYYRSIDEYFYDKQAIFLYQKPMDYLIINKSIFFETKPKSQVFIYDKNNFLGSLRYLRGDHNLENAAATLKVGEILGIDKKKAIEIINDFPGIPYRQQVIGKKNNLIFVNDTTSTTPTATIKAINSFYWDYEIVLFLGGNSKNLPFDELINQLKKVKKIVLLAGSFTDEILSKVKKYQDRLSPKIYDNLEEAVLYGYNQAKKIKNKKPICLLFSPGATSFAMFNNEFHRGDEFNRVVKKII